MRLARILLLALLLGSQVGSVILPEEVFCQENERCGHGGCDVCCVTCPCCAARPLSAATTISLEPVGMRAESPGAGLDALVLPLFATDILHVPKSA
jgi:hypothetical protein